MNRSLLGEGHARYLGPCWQRHGVQNTCGTCRNGAEASVTRSGGWGEWRHLRLEGRWGKERVVEDILPKKAQPGLSALGMWPFSVQEESQSWSTAVGPE